MTVLSPHVQETLRAAASKKLQELSQEAVASDATSWVNGSLSADLAGRDRSAQCRFFDHAGFLKLRSFVDAETCRAMKDEMAALVESEWHPERERDGLDSFGTGAQQNVQRGDYFLESADAVHFFAEPEALAVDEGMQQQRQRQLKPEYAVNKLAALNKAGHALHTRPNTIFLDYCFSDRIRNLLLDLGWKDPVAPQSMYIFKQAVTGGAVNSHQDSTFLFTTPRQTCIGLWLALDEATLENGCLWVRPQSHRNESTRRHYQRNVAHFGEAAIVNRSNVARGDTTTQPKFVMRQLQDDGNDDGPKVPWDGQLPGDGSWDVLLETGFVPIECRPGDLLAFCGELDHLSLPNHSDQARHTFQLHCVEGPSQGITWSEYNWLQYPEGKPFARLRTKQ